LLSFTAQRRNLLLPLPLQLLLPLQLQLQLPLQLLLPLQVPAVILSAAKDPEELRSPQPPEHFPPIPSTRFPFFSPQRQKSTQTTQSFS
jgi:hypothetical protein